MRSFRYRYPVGSLFTGSSLGNRGAFARLSAETDLHGIWCAADNQFYIGEWGIQIHADGEELVARETMFDPESQTTVLSGRTAKAEKQFFLPFSVERTAGEEDMPLEAAIFMIRLINLAPRGVQFGLRHSFFLPAKASPFFTKQPPERETRKQFRTRQVGTFYEITSLGHSSEVRIFGSPLAPSSSVVGERTLCVDYSALVPPGGAAEIPFVLAFSGNGADNARRTFLRCMDARKLLERSIAGYRALLSRCAIITPEPVINRGLAWAKINVARVQHDYRIGAGFTNDPPGDIVVLRDLAWFVLGCDYLDPVFSGELLSLAERYAFHEGGKVTEYIHADEDPPALHDYDLNINDNTPLLVHALFHHLLVSKGDFTLSRAYSMVKRCAEWIIAQMRDDLIWCTAEDTNVWGICGWRNIIDGWTQNGAVTEVNAECCAALEIAAELAARMGEHERAQVYGAAAGRLRTAINTKLRSQKTGLYLLNIDAWGEPHHDLTGDMIFPVIFGLADQSIREEVIARLTREDIWTPYGARTVSPSEPGYDPDRGCQLTGGVWPNLTAWIAFSCREKYPEKLVEGMVNIFKLSETGRPAEHGQLVPGEFPERLDGETFHSRGMAMSPWMPLTYLWLGVEGLVGIKPTLDGPELNPCLPAGWSWIAVKNLPYRGESISAFLYEGVLYSSHALRSRYPLTLGRLIDTEPADERLFSIGLEVEGTSLLFLAADEAVAGTVTVRSSGVAREHSVEIGARGALLVLLDEAGNPQNPTMSRGRQ